MVALQTLARLYGRSTPFFEGKGKHPKQYLLLSVG